MSASRQTLPPQRQHRQQQKPGGRTSAPGLGGLKRSRPVASSSASHRGGGNVEIGVGQKHQKLSHLPRERRDLELLLLLGDSDVFELVLQFLAGGPLHCRRRWRREADNVPGYRLGHPVVLGMLARVSKNFKSQQKTGLTVGWRHRYRHHRRRRKRAHLFHSR